MTDRGLIRKTIRKKRLALSSNDYHRASIAIYHQIVTTSWFLRSQNIAFYLAQSGELDIALVMKKALFMKKHCYLPACHPYLNKLLFTPYTPHSLLKQNRYGILEPDFRTHRSIHPMGLDVIFVPLVAFDSALNRLGSGQGYYDRTFNYLRRTNFAMRPLLVGIAYDFQEVKSTMPHTHDIPMNKIIIARLGPAPEVLIEAK